VISPQKFYTKLTAEELARRKKAEMTKKELVYLEKILNKKQKILDLGCGYGRFTIPLAKRGYDIKGIDITPALIKKAKSLARKENIEIDFRIGDMRKLPYKAESFDAIICMWSVFVELINKKDQLKAINEMLRVLSSKGFAFIEMPPPIIVKEKRKIVEYKEIGDKYIFEKSTNIVTGMTGGIETRPSYNQNKKTLTELIKIAKIKKFRIFTDKFGGRKRFFLKFYK